MHKIGKKLKLLIFILNFDLAKGGGASAPLASPSLVAPLQAKDYFELHASLIRSKIQFL